MSIRCESDSAADIDFAADLCTLEIRITHSNKSYSSPVDPHPHDKFRLRKEKNVNPWRHACSLVLIT